MNASCQSLLFVLCNENECIWTPVRPIHIFFSCAPRWGTEWGGKTGPRAPQRASAVRQSSGAKPIPSSTARGSVGWADGTAADQGRQEDTWLDDSMTRNRV